MRSPVAGRLTLIAAGAVLISGGVIWGAWEEPAKPKPAAKKPAKASSHGGFTPVQTVEQMMEGQKKLFAEIKDGVTDKSWSDVEKDAWILAEIANVNRYQNDDKDYKKFASQMSEQCADLAKLCRKKDESAAKEQVTTIGQTCNACHQQFRKRRR